jgi:very-short-patch-repair endonuclease
MSDLEATLLFQMRAAGLPEPQTEFRFHPTRKWRFDFCFPVERIAVELQGGVWTDGKHGRGSGIRKDYEKLNAAQLLGYMVLQYSSDMVRDGLALADIEQAIRRAKEGEI